MACPVVEAWLADPMLAARGAAGQLCTVSDKRLKRSDVIANGMAIAPVIKHMGARLSIDALQAVVENFFFLARPRGKPTLSRC